MTLPIPKTGRSRSRILRRLDDIVAETLDEPVTRTPQEVVDEAIVRELSTHGARTAAELMAAVDARRHLVIDRTVALVLARILQADPSLGTFALRRRSR